MIIGYARVSTDYQNLDARTAVGAGKLFADKISGCGAGFRSLAEDIDTTTPAGRLVFHVFASIAQFERERISERTKEGLTSARKRGRIGGRPPALTVAQKIKVQRMRDQEQRTVSEIARLFGSE